MRCSRLPRGGSSMAAVSPPRCRRARCRLACRVAPLTLLAVALGVARVASVTAAEPAGVPTVVECPAGTRTSLQYTCSIMGNEAGYQTVCLSTAGTREVHFAYN